MKKKNNSTLSQGPSVRLFKDDLVEVLDILKKHCMNVEIADNNYTYESLEELEDRQGAEPKSIDLIGHSPYISLTVSRWKCSLFGASNEAAAIPFTQIKSLLDSRKRKVVHALFNFPIIIIIWVLGFFMMTALLKGRVQGEAASLYFSIYLMLVMGALYFTFMVKVGALSQVVLKKPHERQPFHKRKRDDILLLVTTNVVTFILTLVAAYFLFRYGIK